MKKFRQCIEMARHWSSIFVNKKQFAVSSLPGSNRYRRRRCLLHKCSAPPPSLQDSPKKKSVEAIAAAAKHAEADVPHHCRHRQMGCSAPTGTDQHRLKLVWSVAADDGSAADGGSSADVELSWLQLLLRPLNKWLYACLNNMHNKFQIKKLIPSIRLINKLYFNS